MASSAQQVQRPSTGAGIAAFPLAEAAGKWSNGKNFRFRRGYAVAVPRKKLLATLVPEPVTDFDVSYAVVVSDLAGTTYTADFDPGNFAVTNQLDDYSNSFSLDAEALGYLGPATPTPAVRAKITGTLVVVNNGRAVTVNLSHVWSARAVGAIGDNFTTGQATLSVTGSQGASVNLSVNLTAPSTNSSNGSDSGSFVLATGQTMTLVFSVDARRGAGNFGINNPSIAIIDLDLNIVAQPSFYPPNTQSCLITI